MIALPSSPACAPPCPPPPGSPRPGALPALAPLVPAARRGAAASRCAERTRAPWRSRSTTGRTRRARPPCSSILRAAGARATFFLVGEQVRRDAGAGARRSRPPGTRSRVHGDRHRNLLRLAPARARATTSTAPPARSHAATGVAPVLHRAPYGIYSLAGAARGPRARLGAAAVVALGPRLARAARPRRRSRATCRRRHRGRGRAPPPRRRRLQRAGELARHGGGAPRDPRRGGRRRAAPGAARRSRRRSLSGR